MQISIYAKTHFFTVYIVQEQKETIKKSGKNINKKYLCVLEF